MHNSEIRVCPIGNYIMSTKHLWILKESSEIYSGLTNNILNPKVNKQMNRLRDFLHFLFKRQVKCK